MSGYNAGFLSDQCTFDQNLKMTTEPCRYGLLLDKFEHVNTAINNNACPNIVPYGCKPCDHNYANIEAKITSIGSRVDIESDLQWRTRPNSRCVGLKYSPENNKTKQVVVNTTLCDRDIVPTNNKMPTTTGF